MVSPIHDPEVVGGGANHGARAGALPKQQRLACAGR